MPSATQHVRSTASRAENSKPLEYLARGGFLCYGVIHLIFAWLALQVAFGGSSNETDQSGALQLVAQQPFGKVLLVVVVIGMVALAVWQLFEAVVGQSGPQNKQAIAERVMSGCRFILYGYFAFLTIKVLVGANASQAQSQKKTTSTVMSHAGGRWLIGIAGIVVIGVGIGLAVNGLTKKFEEHLNTGQMRPSVRKTVRRLGTAGFTAKGVAYAIVGTLLVSAAVTYDPNKATGLDGALKTLAAHGWGVWLLVLIGLGIAAFGVYCFFQARYRKV